APEALQLGERAERLGRARGRARVADDRARKLPHQHQPALVVDADQLGDTARVLACEGLSHGRLAVEERKDRLEVASLPVEHGGERPLTYRLERAAGPRLRLSAPARPRPGRTQLRYRRAALLVQPALERRP